MAIIKDAIGAMESVMSPEQVAKVNEEVAKEIALIHSPLIHRFFVRLKRRILRFGR